MSTITLRSVKGSPLTNAEVDANFSNLNTDKLESSDAVSTNTANKAVRRDASGNFSAGTITASLTGVASTATNIAGGLLGSIPYQSAASTTSLLALGAAGQVLTSTGNSLVWANVGIPAGQSAGSSTTGFIGYTGVTSTVGQFDGGTTTPSGTSRLNYSGYLYATKFVGDGASLTGVVASTASTATASTNIAGGSAGQVPYQVAPGSTNFLAAGTAGQVLTSNGTAGISWGDSISLLENKRSIVANTASTSINLNTGDKATLFKVTISANTSITFANPPEALNGESFSFSVMTVNDSTAGRAVAFGNSIKWAGGVLPPRTTSANAVDVWTFFIEGGVYYGSLSIIDAK